VGGGGGEGGKDGRREAGRGRQEAPAGPRHHFHQPQPSQKKQNNKLPARVISGVISGVISISYRGGLKNDSKSGKKTTQ